MNDSPDYLELQNESPGTKTLNKRPLLIVLGMALFAACVFVYGYVERYEEAYGARKQDEEEVKKLKRYSTPAVTKPEGPDVVLPPSPPPEVFTDTPMHRPMQVQGSGQEPEHVRERREALKAAMLADPTVTAFSQKQTSGQDPGMANLYQPSSAHSDPDPNKQDEKNEFLETFNTGSPYLKHARIAKRSDTEIMAGTIIPGILMTGVNSDLPGQIIGQVSQNVYDSASGRHVLIPAGAKVIGTYDSRVSAGQERVLVAWNRIIFPDSSSLMLDAMPGADMSGFAGMKDQVDNHYWRTFGNAFMLSLFSAGIQLSQPRGSMMGTFSSEQIMAASIGRQLGQLGMQLAQKNLNIQPTLEVRPGFKFSVMITKDIDLPPWQGHPLAGGN